MKNLFLILSILSLCFGAYAQSEGPIVFSMNGAARYKTPDAEKAVKLKTGDQLDETGRIILKEAAEIGIIYDDQFIYLKEPGRYKVADLMAPGELEESDATELFSVRLQEALDPYFGTVKLQRAGFATTTTTTVSSDDGSVRTTLPPKKGTRSGHGNKENGLIRLMPISGEVTGQEVQFAWSITDSTFKPKGFDLIIMDANGKVLSEQAVKGRNAMVDLTSLGLEPGSDFRWRAQSKSDASQNTGDITVKYVAASAETEALSLIQDDPAYKMASPAAKLLMEATAYENAGLLAKANETYKSVRKDFKKDRLGKLMYFAFLWRHDLVK